MIETQMPELYAQWKAAFLRQLEKPDKDSPLIPPENIKRKIYVKLANYIETKIRLRGGIELTAMGGGLVEGGGEFAGFGLFGAGNAEATQVIHAFEQVATSVA